MKKKGGEKMSPIFLSLMQRGAARMLCSARCAHFGACAPMQLRVKKFNDRKTRWLRSQPLQQPSNRQYNDELRLENP